MRHTILMTALSAIFFTATSNVYAAQEPDKIYFGGPIVTMNDEALFAEAVAVKDGEIVAVDRLRVIEEMAGDNTERIDLQGNTMLPGFIDGHSHFLATGINALNVVDLNPPPMGNAESIDDIIEKLKERVKETGEQELISGFGYDDTLIQEMRHPTRADLDKVSTAVPIIITHISGHISVGNSKALELANITKDTKNPDGGRIVKDEEGELTGVMEGNAGALITALIPDRTDEDWVNAIAKGSEIWAAAGFTTAADNLVSPKQIDYFKNALADGKQTVRVNFWPRTRSVEAVREFPAVKSGTDLSDGKRMLVQGPVKFTIDGSPQGYTAHFTEPYSTQRPQDDGNYKGFSYWDDRDEIFDIIEQLHRDGYQLTIHGNGDQGIQDIIDAYSAAQRAYPREDARHGIIHAQFSRPDQLVQMAALDISPSFFIGHTFYWGDRHKNVFFGENRAHHMSPLKGALDAGLVFSTHTDTYITPIDGIQMMWSAVNRKSTSGDVIGPEQRIDPYEALKAITINVAWQFFEEDIKGSIEPGKLADFVILSGNPLTVAHLDPMAIKDIKVLETIVGGETVFKGETSSIIANHFDE